MTWSRHVLCLYHMVWQEPSNQALAVNEGWNCMHSRMGALEVQDGVVVVCSGPALASHFQF